MKYFRKLLIKFCFFLLKNSLVQNVFLRFNGKNFDIYFNLRFQNFILMFVYVLTFYFYKNINQFRCVRVCVLECFNNVFELLDW